MIDISSKRRKIWFVKGFPRPKIIMQNVRQNRAKFFFSEIKYYFYTELIILE